MSQKQITVDITPAAVDPSNPNAKANAAEIQKAMTRLENAVSSKASFLDDLVTEYFLGTENLLAALIYIRERKGYGGVQDRLDMTQVVEDYKTLSNEHNAASHAYMESLKK